MSNLLTMPKRLLVGRPLRSERLGDTVLPKKLALPVFCSDPLSSNAYATEEILLVLSLGGLGLLHVARRHRARQLIAVDRRIVASRSLFSSADKAREAT